MSTIDPNILKNEWYHTIELLPGVWTPGQSFDNLIPARTMLDIVDVRGCACLDIGAMDGLLTFLMERRGASKIVAYDRSTAPRSKEINGDRFRHAHHVLKSSAGFIFDIPFRNLHHEVLRFGTMQFDVTVFSGVLYHMFDPLAALAQLRNLTRTGGVAIIETAAVLSPEAVMYANTKGRFYENDDYWFISVGALEYWLRFLHFQLVDCCYLQHQISEGVSLIRVGLVCRAVGTYLATEDDEWMRKQSTGTFAIDLAEFFTSAPLGPRSEIKVSVSELRPLVWRNSQVLDLHASLLAQGPILPSVDRRRLCQLALGDR
jgi:SAM-dependent methyltransferase